MGGWGALKWGWQALSCPEYLSKIARLPPLTCRLLAQTRKAVILGVGDVPERDLALIWLRFWWTRRPGQSQVCFRGRGFYQACETWSTTGA